MVDIGYVQLGIAAILPVIASVILYFADGKLQDRTSYWLRQAAIGLVFGGLAVLSTEWGIRIDGAVVNCRDSAVLCAGLLFGGPAGIVAGIIGGAERFFAAYWGAGAYTQIACSVSTLVAGFYAAAIRRFILEGKRPVWALAFVAGLVMESFHMAMVFITHLDGMAEAFNVVLACAPPMLIFNSLSVMLATIALDFASRGTLRPPHADKTSMLPELQTSMLAALAIAFLLLFPFEYGTETAVAYTSNVSYLEQNLQNARHFDLSSLSDESGSASYFHVGNDGFVLASRVQDDVIVSGPPSVLGRTLSEVGLENAMAVSAGVNTDELTGYTALYKATVLQADCLCMDAFAGGYRLTAVYPETEAYLDRNRAIVLSVLVQIMLLATTFVLVDYFMKSRVIRPIRNVNDSLREITAGNLDAHVEVRTNLELAQLSDGINDTVNALQRYTHEAEERMAKELELAKEIQHSTLPNRFPPYPGRTEFDIFASMDTAKEVGGDFYDFYFTDRTTFNFLVADVSDKGVPAALFMMRAKTQIKSQAEAGMPVDEVLSRANANLVSGNDSNMFVTAWQGSLNLTDGTVSFANAGHNPPAVRHGNGGFHFVACKRNLVLALMEGAPYLRQELQLAPGDIIFLYTDGVTEAVDAAGELYGNDRLIACLDNADFTDMESLCGAVKADIERFARNTPQADDITLLALRYWG